MVVAARRTTLGSPGFNRTSTGEITGQSQQWLQTHSSPGTRTLILKVVFEWTHVTGTELRCVYLHQLMDI